jgi:single-strand DNA-binding protein
MVVVNKVQMVGRLGRDPELRFTNGKGTPMCFVTLAVDGGYDKQKQEKRTDWIPLTIWGKTAEACAKGLIKGSQVAISGRVSTGKYEKDGKTVYTTDIVAEDVEFLSRPKGDR